MFAHPLSGSLRHRVGSGQQHRVGRMQIIAKWSSAPSQARGIIRRVALPGFSISAKPVRGPQDLA